MLFMSRRIIYCFFVSKINNVLKIYSEGHGNTNANICMTTDDEIPLKGSNVNL